MKYRPTSAGLRPRASARDAAQGMIDERVLAAAEEWLAENSTSLRAAVKKTEGCSFTAAATGLLTMHPQLQLYENAYDLGFFISALWNKRCAEQMIVWPHATPQLVFLGKRLPKEKTLIITGDAGNYVGERSEGPIIIAGNAQNVGSLAKGVIIVPGTWTYESDIRCPFVTPENYAQNAALKEYVSRLIACATADPATAEREFGDGVAIKQHLVELIAGGKS